MFKKLLNVGKGHSAIDKLHQQQQQLQQKNLFQLNEVKSYGFSHQCCLGYSPSLSLLAVGSKYGLLRILGNPSVEYNHQLESGNSIRQIEFIDCSQPQQQDQNRQNKKQDHKNNSKTSTTTTDKENASVQGRAVSAKIVVLTDNGQLHLFQLITVKPQNFTDNTTQTDPASATISDCCQQPPENQAQQQQQAVEYTRLERVGFLDYFKFKPDDEDRSRRVTTFEVSTNKLVLYVGTEGGNLYLVPLSKFELTSDFGSQQKKQPNDSAESAKQNDDVPRKSTDEATAATTEDDSALNKDGEATCAVNLNDEPQIEENVEPFEMIKFDEDVAAHLGDDVKSKKQGAIESIKRHPKTSDWFLVSYHRGLSVLYNLDKKSVEKYFYHNQVLESSCFADQNGDFFYTSHNDGSYIRWDTRPGSQSKANDDFLGQLYGPYPCKPTPKIQACTGLIKDQLEELVIFSGGMPRATYDDKNPVTIVRSEADGKDTIKTVLDFTSKVLDFVVITRPRGNLGAGAKSTGGGKKNKHKKQQEKQQNQHQPSSQIAVALAILAEEEFVVIDLLNSESYLEFPLPYLNCVHSSAITCNQHYSDISEELYGQLLAYNKQQLKGKLSANEWPITGGKVIDAPEVKSHDILLTGHEDGSVDFWDVSELSMRHLLHLSTSRLFSTNDDDDLVPIDGTNKDNAKADQDENAAGVQTTANNEDNSTQQDSAWPPLKKVGRFDPYSDDTRLAIRKLSLCPLKGTLAVAGTGGQILVFEFGKSEPVSVAETLVADEVTIVNDQRFTWKGRGKLAVRSNAHKELQNEQPGYQVSAFVQLDPPVAATSLDLRSDWHLFAVGTNYGFLLYDYAGRHSVVTKCTLNVQDYSIVSGDAPGAGTISRKKSFRKSLRESFRRLRRGRSQRQQQVGGGALADSGAKPAFGRVTTGVRTLNAPSSVGDSGTTTGGVGVGVGVGVHRNVYSTERQVEQKVELSSIVRCITLTSAFINSDNQARFQPSLWVGTNAGQVLVYAIKLASEQQQPSSDQQQTAASDQEQASSPELVVTSARLIKEIQLKHKAPIIAIFTSPDAPHVEHALSDVESQKPTTDSPTRESVTSGGEQQAASEPIRAQTPSADKSPSGKSGKNVDVSVQVQQQPRVLICSEEQFKVFNLPNLKPFCKFKLTAHEGLRAKKISITQFLKPATQTLSVGTSNKQLQVANQSANSLNKSLQSFATQTSPSASPVPAAAEASGEDAASSAATANGAQQSGKQTLESNNNLPTTLNNNHTSTKEVAGGSKELMNAKFGAKSNSNSATSAADKDQSGDLEVGASLYEPYMVCMSNQGDCAIYSVPDLKRQAQIQVCKREDVNGITSTMLTNYGEGYYLKSSSNFLRFSISTHRVLRVLSVV